MHLLLYISKYEQLTLNGALVVTFAMLRCLINFHTNIIIVINISIIWYRPGAVMLFGWEGDWGCRQKVMAACCGFMTKSPVG